MTGPLAEPATAAVTEPATGAGPDRSAGAALGYARDVLDGIVPTPKGRATRAAAVLTRQALEGAVCALCRTAGFDLDKTTMESRLIAARVLVGADDADTAGTAWAG